MFLRLTTRLGLGLFLLFTANSVLYASSSTSRPRLALLIPHDDLFWQTGVRYARAAANDLEVQLRVYSFKDNAQRQMELLREAIAGGVDGIIFQSFEGTGESVLRLTEKHKIPAFLINTPMMNADFPPRTKYRYWVGSMIPNDKQAGMLLIQQLLQLAEKSSKQIHVLAIEGDPAQEASVARRRGLEIFTRHHPDIRSLEIASGYWNPDKAVAAFQRGFARNNNINVVWVANDNMALAVAEASRRMQINHPLLIGGIDWDSRALAAVSGGRMHVDVGGHFLEPAWALVLLHDYLKGNDFAGDGVAFDTPMFAVNPASSRYIADFLKLPAEELNFRKLSKTYNKRLLRYPLQIKEFVSLVGGNRRVELTENEKSWLRKHKSIRMGIDPAWPPFEYVDAGQIYKGMCSEFVKMISKQAGIEPLIDFENTWAQVVEKSRKRQVDVLPCVVKSSQRMQFLNFTDPYLSFPMVILTRNEVPYIGGIEEIKGKIALVRSYVTQDILMRDFPQKTYYLADTVDLAISAVRDGKAFAYIGNLAAISHSLGKLGYTDLKVSGHTPYKFDLAFAVRKDWPELIPILNKYLKNIDEGEKSRIISYWANTRIERTADLSAFWPYLSGLIFIIATILVWNLTLKAKVNQRTAKLKAGEIELQKHKQHLEKLVRERTAELEKTNESLAEQRLRLTAALEAANAGTFIIDMDRDTIQWDQKSLEIHGMKSDDGKQALTSQEWKKRIHPDELHDLESAIKEAVESVTVSSFDVTYRVIKVDGDLCYIHAQAWILRDDYGRARIISGLQFDITERIENEQQLKDAKESAEKAYRAKSQFLSSMSHELRTPMNAILGFSQMLEMYEELSAAQKQHVAEISKAGKHLLALINDVLDLSRIEADKVRLQMQRVNLTKLMRECFALVIPLGAKQQLQFSNLVEAAAAIYVYADQTRLKQVLINLLSNAVKYNRPHGYIEATCRESEHGMVRIGITDSGLGIEADQQDKLFEPFDRLGREFSGIEGTGVGLTVSKKLVELMGGKLGFSSVPDKGSTFWIEVKSVAAEGGGEIPGRGQAVAEETGKSPAAGHRHTILYVEDNHMNARLVANIVNKIPGKQLLIAYHPSEGLALAEKHQPDLILLDIHLPDMDGYEVLARLRDNPKTSSIPVVALSANAFTSDLQSAEQAGFNDYLTKPLDIRRFLDVLQQQLGTREDPQTENM